MNRPAHHSLSLALILLFWLCASSAGQEKASVPDDAAQARAETMIKQVYKAEYAKTITADRRALAKKLLEQARDTKGDAASRFVLLREARTIAAANGDMLTAFRAVEQMAQAFGIDVAETKFSIITTSGRAVDDLQNGIIFIREGVALVDYYSDVQDFAAATKLAQPLSFMAGQTRNNRIIAGVRLRMEKMREAQAEFDKLKLSTNRPPAGDPNGDLASGKMACFFKEDWTYGLGRFTKCNDTRLRETAQKDLKNPTIAGDRLMLANEWWDMGQKHSGFAKTRFQARARHWYKLALLNLGGLERSLAEKRILSSLGAPEDASLFAGHAYSFDATPMTWHEAALTCELLGGYLVCVESSDEHEFVVQLANKRQAWLGASDEQLEDNWRWVNGQPVVFKAWRRPEPNNSDGLEHYMMLGSAGRWNDNRKEQKRDTGFICEWE
jgi:hypothetical protein